MKYIAKIIWDLAEYTGIGLGRFAPYVFGMMIGAKPVKVKDEVGKDDNR